MGNPFPQGGLSNRRGYTPPKRYVPNEQKEAYAEEWPDLRPHVDHGAWEHVGPCVYCVKCPDSTDGQGTRLFQARGR